ncbi:MAG: fibronectin type III domain-containing protein [Chthoniobacterales bacterium]|nr:fibronectin type III domain-containing protein [Chthoniobacterales bacterium]
MKTTSHSCSANWRDLATSLRFSVSLLVLLVALGLFLAVSALAQSAEPKWQPQAGEHIARTRDGESISAGIPSEELTGSAVAQPVMAPTRSSFLASWKYASEARGYRLDVSVSRSFESYVSGYRDLDVGNVTSRIVSGLAPGKSYYYRVRAYNLLGIGSSSETLTTATATSSGLVIDPTFDSSILDNPRSATIQTSITQTIALYQSLFSDPITVSILFRFAATLPNGTPFPAGEIARSNFVVYPITWSSYLSSLRSDATTADDASANSSLPPNALSSNIVPSSASGRAIGLSTPKAMFANGTVAVGGPYDGIVTLNSSQPFRFSRPPTTTEFDARRATEHEMDEILGLGSHLNSTPSTSDLRPQDLFTWAASGNRNTTAIGSRYLSVDSGNSNIVNLNQGPGGDFGDWLSGVCPQVHPRVQNAFGCKGQVSDVAVSSPEGINLDIIGYDLAPPGPTPVPVPATFGNISTRLRVETGDDVLIGGFIVTGTQPKKIIARAIGPSLPVTGKLLDPFLELHGPSGDLIASNDNWRSDQEAEIRATGIPPANDSESAIVMTLDPDSYTAIVKGAQGGSGVALVEVYDLDSSVDSKLANISTRGLVQNDDNVLIGGFIVVGTEPAQTLLRAIGPSLPLSGALADPTLELHDKDGTTIASNDNWRSDQEADIIATGISPKKNAESAILVALAPDSYTAIVRGKDNTKGLALVEVYELDN